MVTCGVPHCPGRLVGRLGTMLSSRAVSTRPSRELQTFPNPHPGRDYVVYFDCPEFTCVCPLTGQPDFASLEIWYVPDGRCVELKSLKLYLWSFRDEGAFHEDITNRILDDLVRALEPRFARIVGDFKVRGGIRTIVTARHTRDPGYREPPEAAVRWHGDRP